jgi:hypothetical protein
MTKTLEALLEATGRTMAEIRPGEVAAKVDRCMPCPRLLLICFWGFDVLIKTWEQDLPACKAHLL